MKEPTTILRLNWNQLHIQSREALCTGAAISKESANLRWEVLELWIQLLLTDSLNRRSSGKLELGNEQKCGSICAASCKENFTALLC